MQQMTDDIKANNKAIEKKTATKAKRLEDAATAKGDKETTEASKAKDEGVLSDTNAECKQTSDEYEKNQVVRIGEKHLPASLLQTKATALPQLRSTSDFVRQRVV